MVYLLNLIYCVVLVAVSPWLFWRFIRKGRYREGWRAKLWGAVPRRSSTAPAIWLHAVSVGEVRVAATLAETLREYWPDHELIVSATTRTGFQLARRSFPSDLVSYAPLDFSWAIRRALRRWRPSMLILVELELWPNLISLARRQGVANAIVNGRLSDSSWHGYRRIRFLVARWLQAIDLIAVQNANYAARFRQLGAPSERVIVTGSIKFDGVSTDRDNPSTARLREQAGFQTSDRVWVVGSTQAPEEQIALAAYMRLASAYSNLQLILVPRHPERFDEVAALLSATGVPFTRWTDYVRVHAREPEPRRVERILLIDQVGDLRYWWGLAHVGFVGGSLSRRGGQNMIEPAAFGIPICFGPNVQNFADVVDLLLAEQAAEIVRDVQQLEQFVHRCLEFPAWSTNLGIAAARVVQKQQGASQRTATVLAPLLMRNEPAGSHPRALELHMDFRPAIPAPHLSAHAAVSRSPGPLRSG